MRALLCLLLVTGCAAGTDAALTGQDAKSTLGAKDAVATRLRQMQLAQMELLVITRQAQIWAEENGVMTGFADDLRKNQPFRVGTMVELSDTSVTLPAGIDRCLTAELPWGEPTTVAC